MIWRALLLAGGQSSRMGQDKALLDWNGQPLVVAMRDRLQALGAADVRISGDYAEWGGIPDEAPRLGPIGGLDAALRTATDGIWLIVPVDMPRLDADLNATLLDQHRDNAALCYAGHALPLRLRLDHTSRAVLAQLMDACLPPRERSLRSLHRALGGVEIDVDPKQAEGLVNCNTPAEWARICA